MRSSGAGTVLELRSFLPGTNRSQVASRPGEEALTLGEAAPFSSGLLLRRDG